MMPIQLLADPESRDTPVSSVLPSVSQVSGERRHIPGLDGLRGLAIIGVMLFHFLPYSDEAGAANPLIKYGLLAAHAGQTGVDLFFVLSGFLITGILLDTKNRPHYFKYFYARRTLRIFPLYYGALVVIASSLLIKALLDNRMPEDFNNQIWLWLYLTNVAVFLGISTPAVHFWSLAVEEHFYLIWPWLVFFLSRKALVFSCVFLIAAALGLRLVLALQGLDTFYLTPCRMDQLACGGLLAVVAAKEGRLEAISGGLRWLFGALLIALIPLYLWKTGTGDPLIQTLKPSLLAATYACLLVWIVVAPPRSLIAMLFSSQLMRAFGKYSYGLYVFHGLLGSLCDSVMPMDELKNAFNSFVMAACVRVCLAVGASFMVAWLSWHLYEKRFLKLKRFFA
jgi:peptidoglycan/LPS O-acetylase OafA/YrhL